MRITEQEYFIVFSVLGQLYNAELKSLHPRKSSRFYGDLKDQIYWMQVNGKVKDSAKEDIVLINVLPLKNG